MIFTPRPLEPALGVHLLDPQVRCDLGRLGADGQAEGVAERVRRVRRQHERAVPGVRRGDRRTGRRRGLADPALAGEEDDPHSALWLPVRQERDSTRFLSPFSAVSMMTFSALRLSMPIIGMEMSTASR